MGKLKHEIKKGEVFYRLTTISDVYRNEKERVIDVKCECGTKKTVTSRKLKVGKIKSCGCLQREKASKSGTDCILPNGEAVFNRIFKGYKNSSKKRGYKWNLSKLTFRELIKKDCYYCGDKPNRVRKSRNGADDYIYNGVDRVDNSKGYTEENVVSCCTFCNKAKNIHTKEYFIKKCKEIAENVK